MWFLLACAGSEFAETGDTASDAPLDSGDSDTSTLDDTDTAADTALDTASDTAAHTDTAEDTGGGVDLSCTPSDLAACDDAGCALVLDIETASVSGSLSLDGANVPEGWEIAFAGPTATWQLWSWWDETGPGVTLNVRVADIYRVEAAGGAWAGRVPLGEWDTFLVRIDGNTLLDRVPLGHVTIDGDTTLNVSASRHTVDLWLGVGGVALGSATSWGVVLRETTSDALHLVESGDSLSVALPAGEWKATLVPESSALGFAEGNWDLGSFTVAEDGPVVLDADAVAVGGALSWDGAPTWELAPHGKSGFPWRVILRDVASDNLLQVDVDAGEPWSTLVPPGTYDLELQGNERGYGPFGVDLTDDATVDIDVTTYAMGGVATWLGAPIASSGTWWLSLTSEHSTIYATTAGSNWEASVPEGVWDIWVQRNGGPVTRVATDVLVAADGTLDVNSVDYALSGTMTFAGGPPPDSPGISDWAITFEDTEHGTTNKGGGRSDEPWEVRLPAGTYDVSMSWADEDLWYSPETLIMRDLVVTGDMVLPFSVDASWLDVSFLLDGSPAPAGEYSTMYLTWTDLETGFTNQGTFDASETTLLLPHGSYTFWGLSDALRSEGTEHVALFGTCVVVE